MCCPVCGMVHIKDPLLLMVCLIIHGLVVIEVCLIYIMSRLIVVCLIDIQLLLIIEVCLRYTGLLPSHADTIIFDILDFFGKHC